MSNMESCAVSKPVEKKQGIKWANLTSYIGLVILVIVSALVSDSFLLPVNIMNVLRQISIPGIIAVGMTLVILSGGIDLSVGTLVAMTGVMTALAIEAIGWLPAIFLALLLGAIVGICYGYFITRLRVPPFITTLAGWSSFKGVALVITGTAAVRIKSEEFNFLGSGILNLPISLMIVGIIALFFIVRFILELRNAAAGNLIKRIFMPIGAIAGLAILTLLIFKTGGLSVQIVIFAFIVLLFWFVLNKTIFGRQIYAIGGNIEASYLAGIKVRRNITYVHMICSMLAALASVLTAARIASGTPQIGGGWELDAIAAVVIGGTSMTGGMGTIGGTIVGVFLIGVLNNLLSLLNVSSDMQLILKGLIILFAVVIDTNFKHSDK